MLFRVWGHLLILLVLLTGPYNHWTRDLRIAFFARKVKNREQLIHDANILSQQLDS